MTSGQELGTWLRQQREARCWARSEMARQLIKAALANGDTTMPCVDNLTHNIYRRERGTVGPSERYRLCYCRVLGIESADFGLRNGTVQTFRASFPGTEIAGFFRLLADFVALVRDLRAEIDTCQREDSSRS